jgi:hypothetical protein
MLGNTWNGTEQLFRLAARENQQTDAAKKPAANKMNREERLDLIKKMETLQLTADDSIVKTDTKNQKVLMIYVQGASNLANRDEFSLSDT